MPQNSAQSKQSINEDQLAKMRNLYNQLTKCEILSDYEDQIMKDLQRTFPRCPQFKSQKGLDCLKRVLLAFSRYDQSIGYVQGMNFIVASLLYHCSEEIAFWIFVTLIEDYELRDIFEQHLPGLYKHSYIITTMCKETLPELH
jgi:Rab-GTPase-TBC domain